MSDELFAIRNKRTGRLLKVSPALHQSADWDYGGVDERLVDWPEAHFLLQDDEYNVSGTVVFVTPAQALLDALLSVGVSKYPDVRIDFGHSKSKFQVSDLERCVITIEGR